MLALESRHGRCSPGDVGFRWIVRLPRCARGKLRSDRRPKPLGWRPAKWALDNWELSGITTFQTGSPFTPDFTTTDAQDITGSTDSARINVIGDPNVSSRTFYHNTAAFTRPAQGTFGNAGTNILYGPGINNWDIAASKRFPIFSESKSLQFRVEIFNAWNPTQFSGQFSTARFDPTGAQVDPNFGAYSAARLPRNIRLSARFVF